MNILVGPRIVIIDPTPAVEKWCHNNLVLDNPEYIKRRRMNLWTGNVPSKLFLYEKDGYCLYLPYGCLRDVLALSSDSDTIQAVFGDPVPIDYGGDPIPLYDYQQRAVDEAINARYGIIQAPAGSGKTQMGIALVKRFGRRALWITHTHDLLEQSRERAEQYMKPFLIGTITEGKVFLGQGITFATVQTLSKIDLWQYDDWDTIIVDECHRAIQTPGSVTMFSKVLNSLTARHKYGLSATIHRADGMIQATHALLGPVVAHVSKEDVSGKIMTVTVLPRFLDTPVSREYCDTDGTIIYSKLISWLGTNTARNAQIATDLIENRDHYNLVLSARLDQLSILMQMLPPDLRELAVMIDGKMQSKKAKAERHAALQDMREGKKRYLFATYALAREGLDIPILDRLYLATPEKDAAIIEQSLGRIARTSEGKEGPLVIDYVDKTPRNLVKSYKRRCTIYRKLGCPIQSE